MRQLVGRLRAGHMRMTVGFRRACASSRSQRRRTQRVICPGTRVEGSVLGCLGGGPSLCPKGTRLEGVLGEHAFSRRSAGPAHQNS